MQAAAKAALLESEASSLVAVAVMKDAVLVRGCYW